MRNAKAGFVLDCSVTMAWCFEDEAEPSTEGIRDQLVDVPAIVPALWPLEVANAALVGERRGRLDEARTARFFTLLGGLPIIVDQGTSEHAFGRVVHLARTHKLSSYDASYLEIAMRHGLPLATLDGKLRAAAQAVGVPLLGSD